MIVGEDKNKVQNIVTPQVEAFRQLYQPYLMSDTMTDLLHWHAASNTFTQNYSSKVILHHLNLLPKHVQRRLYINWSKNGASRDLDDVLLSISNSYGVSAHVKRAVEEIVWSSSISQSVKGLLTAGFVKSFKYSFKKLRKMYNSLVKV